jgi:pimeloyl-ACP methyl ester carboxylesterase
MSDSAELPVAAGAGRAHARRAIAARYAIGHGERISLLVLVDAPGVGPFRPVPGSRWRWSASWRDRPSIPGTGSWASASWIWRGTGSRSPLMASTAPRTPSKKAAGRSLMKAFGVSAIPEAELARIRVPTALIWGRHLQARLRVAEAASARYGWPLHVIEDCGVDPNVEQPGASLDALRAELDGR